MTATRPLAILLSLLCNKSAATSSHEGRRQLPVRPPRDSSASGAGAARAAISVRRGGKLPGRLTRRRTYRFIDDLFDRTDLNRDNNVTLEEVYELVLRMYIKLNQQAPIPPPTRDTVSILFHKADRDRSKVLDRDQFRNLMLVLYSRAASRLFVVKLSKVFLAPVLAVQTVRVFRINAWWADHVAGAMPERLDMLLDPKLWTTVLTVLFVITIGGAALSATNLILDGICGVRNTEKEEVDSPKLRE